MPLRLITPSDLDALSSAAQSDPRRRRNLNLHADYQDPCQRLFNAVEPGSYIRPHRHTEPPKPEFFLAVRGRFVLLLFNDEGGVVTAAHLAPDGPEVAVDIAPGQWHTIVALEPGSIFFEAKPGPYAALTDKEFAPWAPAEESADVPQYLETLYAALLDAD
jgi:cupin fold WbuC family metalloprotein